MPGMGEEGTGNCWGSLGKDEATHIQCKTCKVGNVMEIV